MIKKKEHSQKIFYMQPNSGNPSFNDQDGLPDCDTNSPESKI